jgi:hypothetical protein
VKYNNGRETGIDKMLEYIETIDVAELRSAEL